MIRGEIEGTGLTGKATFVSYAKPFKSLINGTQVVAGYDVRVSWSITQRGASIDKDTAPESLRCDADLHYPLHQPDYFRKLKLAGITEFDGAAVIGRTAPRTAQ